MPTWRGVLGAFNAPNFDNWVYGAAMDPDSDLEFYRQPSGFNPQAENLANLPPGYYDRMIGGMADWEIKRFIENEFGNSRDGEPVYPEYRDQIHCALDPIEPVRGVPLRLSADAGRNPAVLIHQNAAGGQHVTLDEIVAERANVELFACKVAEILDGPKYRGLSIESAVTDPTSFNPTESTRMTDDGDDAVWARIMADVTATKPSVAKTAFNVFGGGRF